MSVPDITILMLTYNHAWSLAETLESLLQQTYQDFRLILVDDGSQDETIEIARQFEGRFKHYQVLQNEKNLGVIENYHRALITVEKESNPDDFYLWACPDDRWSPEYLEKMRQALIQNPDAVAAQSFFDIRNVQTGETELHCLLPLSRHIKGAMRQTFQPVRTPTGNAYYNNMLHGLMRLSEMRNVYSTDRRQLAAAISTEISMIVSLLMRGDLLIVPETLFHKQAQTKFAHPDHHEITRNYKSFWKRTWFAVMRLSWFLKIRKPDTSHMTVFVTWMRLLSYYSVMTLYERTKISIRQHLSRS